MQVMSHEIHLASGRDRRLVALSGHPEGETKMQCEQLDDAQGDTVNGIDTRGESAQSCL